MKVLKFGGTSCADSHQVKKIVEIVHSDPSRRVVVVSAPGKRNPTDHKITDMLYLMHQMLTIDMGAGEVFSGICDRFLEIRDGLHLNVSMEGELSTIRDAIFRGASLDYTLSRGEYLCAKLVAAALGYDFVDAAELLVFDEFGAIQMSDTAARCQERLSNGTFVVPGFYGANTKGEIITFPRGGSDITGSLLAAALQAECYENWTDVSGFLATDPSIVPNPQPIRVITYQELHELSYMGAQVLHEDAVYPARRAGIPIHIKNTNDPDAEGTHIVPKLGISDRIVTGISGKTGFLVVNVTKRHGAGDSGFLRRLISVFEANECAIEHIPSSIDTVSVIVRENPFRSRQKKILEEIDMFSEPDQISVTGEIALLAVVGEGMAERPGVAARIFDALGRAGISIKMILQGSSELNIILGVIAKDYEAAVQALYVEFFKEEV